MFRKLVSNLPFSPSLINQVGFYSRRLKKEDITRRIGLIFTALALVVQTLSFLAPAKATLAASLNDIIYGGGTRSTIKAAVEKNCDSKNRCDLKAIFGAYGITPANIANAKEVNIVSSAANNYWSIGRSPRGYGGEVTKNIPGGPTIYARTLHGWAANKSWRALQVTTNSGGTAWILEECGNIVTKEGSPAPPVQPPDVTIDKTVSKTTVKRGEKFYYDLKITNIGKGQAKDVLIYDTTVPGLELQSDGLSTDPLVTVMRWQTKTRHNIAPGQTMKYRLYAIARSSGPATLMNKACVDIIDANVYNNCDQVPVTVEEPCLIPGKTTLAKDDPQCKSNPAITVDKSSDKSSVKLGDTFTYTVSTTNKGDVDLTQTAFNDKAPAQIEFLEIKEPGEISFKAAPNKREYTSKLFSLTKGKTVTAQIKARVIATSTSAVKNTVCVIATNPQSNATTGTCDDATITIPTTSTQVEYCPYPGKQNLPKSSPLCKPDTPQQQELCKVPGKENLPKNDPNCKQDPKPDMCTVPGKENLPKNDPKCKPDCTLDPTILFDDPRCQPCPIEGKTNLPKNSPNCKPCDETKKDQSGKDISCLELHKKARNITQQIANANGTQANTGDTIEYTLSVKNLSKVSRTGFVIEENMDDVLEYADILDASGAVFTQNPVKMLSWSGVTIKPGETVSRTILIKVKSTLPNTPASTSDPLSNDMRMVNVYGDTIRITLPKTPIKTVEQTITKLPSTGFGSNVIISTVLLMAVVYFYFRNRTMVKELALVRQQFNYAAGV